MSNIREVAKHAGVSVATVSRYLSSPERVSKKSADKVRAAIDLLHYKPNLLARNFFQARSNSILVLVPNIANLFFAKVIRGIEYIALQKGYSVMLGDTRMSKAREAEYFCRAETRQADGVIQLSPNLPGVQNSATLRIPIVNACECMENAPCPTVMIDNTSASRRIVEHLLSLGHRRIGCVLGSNAAAYGRRLTPARLEGFRQALEAYDVKLDERYLVQGDYSARSGLNAAAHFTQMDPMPTAIFCMNDEMAIGLIQGLKQEGLRVPHDVSVAGFDDMDFAKYCDPPLTTIFQPAEDMGRTAMIVLDSLLLEQSQSKACHVLPYELILRESTAPPKSGTAV